MVELILRIRLFYSMGLDLDTIHEAIVLRENVSEENFYLAYCAGQLAWRISNAL